MEWNQMIDGYWPETEICPNCGQIYEGRVCPDCMAQEQAEMMEGIYDEY